jgi:hypothetical protein
MSEKLTLLDDPIGRQAQAWYEAHKAQFEPEHNGHYLSLDVDSGDYELAPDIIEAVHKLRARRPDASLYTLRIGTFTIGEIGGGSILDSTPAVAK